jgi:HAMP domain-containing protein
MLSFRNLSLRRKQTLVIMFTTSVVLLLACAAFSIYEVTAFRNTMKLNLATLADLVDHNTTAALDFNDPASAKETLEALRADPAIIGAWLYRNGQDFAHYDRPNDNIIFTPPAVLPNGTVFQGDRLILCRPSVIKGETVGTLYLESDMVALRVRLTRYAAIVGAVFLVSLLVALGLSSQLQRVISDPILQLARLTKSVALEKNYSVRAKRKSNDELGQLVDGFNEMLVQIQARDSDLQHARDTLEQRVDERTRELEATHKQLVEASRLGGMAEIATNVLHNVGNVLNSVNVSASQSRGFVAQPRE